MKILLLAVGYLISLIPPVIIACALAAIAGGLLHLWLFAPQPVQRVPVRKTTKHRYTNAMPTYHGRRWPVAVGCAL